MMKNIKINGNLLFVCRDNLNKLWLFLSRFHKLPFLVKMTSIHGNIVFKFFHFGDSFQKLSLSVKMIIVFIVFV